MLLKVGVQKLITVANIIDRTVVYAVVFELFPEVKNTVAGGLLLGWTTWPQMQSLRLISNVLAILLVI